MENDVPAIVENNGLTFDIIYDHIINGGCLHDLAQIYKLKYSIVVNICNSDKIRYSDAIMMGENFVTGRVMKELQSIAMIDIRTIFDEFGVLKDPSDWPAETAAAIESIETFEEHDKEGVFTGRVRKIKLNSKIQALKLIGEKFGMFKKKIEVGGTLVHEHRQRIFKFNDVEAEPVQQIVHDITPKITDGK